MIESAAPIPRDVVDVCNPDRSGTIWHGVSPDLWANDPMKQFSSKTFLIITFFLAATALALSLKVFNPITTHNREAGLERELEDLEQRIEQLSSALESLHQAETDPAIPSEPIPRTPLVAQEIDSSAETRVREIGDTMEDIRWTMSLRGMMPPTSEHIERSRRLLSDSEASLSEQLAALRLLRKSDQLTDDDVRQMIKVFNAMDDERSQIGIIKQLDDVRTPEFLDTLMRVSSTSENARVRQEAIDSLSGYLPDPDLKDWLEIVAQDDPNSRVRREARRLLDRYWGSEESGEITNKQ
jgi:hypothetical protein